MTTGPPPPKSGPRRATKAKPKRKRKKAKPRIRAGRPTGRPHSCTEKVIKAICEARALGASWEDSAANADKSRGTVMDWCARAKNAIEAVGYDWESELPENIEEIVAANTPKEVPFVNLLYRAQRAYDKGTVALLASAARSAHGGAVFEARINPDTGESQRVQVGYVQPDARIGLKLLALRSAKYSELRRHEVSGKGGGALVVQLYMPEEVEEP